jgi:hypothetical protein
MATVLHKYVPADKKPPKPPTPEEQELKRLKAAKLQSDREFVEEKRKQTEVARILAEAELLRKRGELISRATAVRHVGTLFTAVKQRLLNLAPLLSRKLEGKNAHQRKVEIDAAIREVLLELSEPADLIAKCVEPSP